jgi:tetratricopeptide (TPR) repeat protein
MSSVDEAVAQAVKERSAGNYRGGLELLRPFLIAREKLSPQQECSVVGLASGCYRALQDFKAALPLAQRCVVLEQQLAGPRSLRYAHALQDVCVVHQVLKDFVAASKAIRQALAIMEELGLQCHEGYGSMLMVLGWLDLEQRRYKEALAIHNKAKAVLVHYKEGNEYGLLLGVMAVCHQCLHQWNEAVACYKEAVEHRRNMHGINHPKYAAALYNLAVLFDKLKQYEEAIPRYEEAGRGCMETSTSSLLCLPSVLLLPANMLSNLIATRSMWATNNACATSAARSRRRWSGALDAAVCGIATRSASCSTGPRTSRYAMFACIVTLC